MRFNIQNLACISCVKGLTQNQFSQFSCPIMSNSLRPHGLATHQASLSITNSRSILKLMPIESVMLSNHLILCCPIFLPPSIFPSIRVFSNESVLRIRWPKYGSFSFSISPSIEYSELIFFKMDWLDLLESWGLLQHHSSKASILQCSAFLWSNSHIHIWLLENHSFDYMDLCWQSNVSAF